MEKVTIKQIRYDLTWQVRHEVMYPDFPFDHIKLENDEEGLHFGLYIDHQLTSVVSLFRKGNDYQFRKFATRAIAQGSGYGSSLLAHLINHVKEKGALRLWCNARVSAAGFYERFGLEQTGPVFINDEIDFVRMKIDWL